MQTSTTTYQYASGDEAILDLIANCDLPFALAVAGADLLIAHPDAQYDAQYDDGPDRRSAVITIPDVGTVTLSAASAD